MWNRDNFDQFRQFGQEFGQRFVQQADIGDWSGQVGDFFQNFTDQHHGHGRHGRGGHGRGHHGHHHSGRGRQWGENGGGDGYGGDGDNYGRSGYEGGDQGDGSYGEEGYGENPDYYPPAPEEHFEINLNDDDDIDGEDEDFDFDESVVEARGGVGADDTAEPDDDVTDDPTAGIKTKTPLAYGQSDMFNPLQVDGVSSEVRPYKGQVYEQLKPYYNSENLFVDPEFPPEGSSIYYTKSTPHSIEWKRPQEMRQDASFFVGGPSRMDLDQGMLGNCWFIAGAAVVATNGKIFTHIVPKDQGLPDQDPSYGGIFHFRFWRFGEWVDVVVDDLLPCVNNKVIFCKNKEQPNEFWPCLMEKAYAKLNGSYETLEGGLTADALTDMTGGVQENFELKDVRSKRNFFDIILQASKLNSLMGCSIDADPNVKEARLSNGLVRGHAFSITRVARFKIHGRTCRLLRLRNPWGNEVEWNGDWSDNSHLWNNVSPEGQQHLGLVKDHDGEFWMNFRDWTENFQRFQIVHLTPDAFSEEIQARDKDLTWCLTQYHGNWKNGLSAGGCGNASHYSFWTNPQYLMKVEDPDENDHDPKCTILMSLIQKHSRQRRMEQADMANSGEYYVQLRTYQVKDDAVAEQIIAEQGQGAVKLSAHQLRKVGSTGSYINMREVTARLRLDPGYYIFIPSTYHENQDGQFLVRLFTEKPANGTYKIPYNPGPENLPKYEDENKWKPMNQVNLNDLLRQLLAQFGGQYMNSNGGFQVINLFNSMAQKHISNNSTVSKALDSILTQSVPRLNQGNNYGDPYEGGQEYSQWGYNNYGGFANTTYGENEDMSLQTVHNNNSFDLTGLISSFSNLLSDRDEEEKSKFAAPAARLLSGVMVQFMPGLADNPFGRQIAAGMSEMFFNKVRDGFGDIIHDSWGKGRKGFFVGPGKKSHPKETCAIQ
ncbi:hypothetical protein SNEBB_000810 [Seison nebaliae]|nr:hypothetical protein SNEBB_000810 [Seison nebaliae]